MEKDDLTWNRKKGKDTGGVEKNDWKWNRKERIVIKWRRVTKWKRREGEDSDKVEM